MHLTRLSVKGFRSLKDVTWEPGKLNVVIGPNGSGKTNLIKCLEMLQWAASGRLQDYLQDVGGMYSVLWDGNGVPSGVDSNASFSISLDAVYDDGSNGVGWHHFIEVSSIRSFGIVSDEVFSEEGDGLLYDYSEGEMTYFRVDPFYEGKNNGGEMLIYKINRDYKIDIVDRVVSSYIGIWNVFHIDVSDSAKLRIPPVARYDTSVSRDGQNLINVLHTLYTENREFKRTVNASMRAAFGDDFDELIFPPAADQRVQMRVRWKSLKREQSTADLSDGTLRFLFLLAVLANPNPPPLIAIDEPETGLHPSMMPLIAELAVEASKKSQIIFTTHSDQFLDAFGDTRPTTTVAKWEDGQTKLHIVDDDELAHFLKGYSLGALFRSGELESDFLARKAG